MNFEFVKYIAAAVAFSGAAPLAYYEKEGWGWLIFAGIAVATL